MDSFSLGARNKYGTAQQLSRGPPVLQLDKCINAECQIALTSKLKTTG